MAQITPAKNEPEYFKHPSCNTSKNTFEILDELLRFRHFRRYYFNFSYDWDKINLLSKKYNDLHPILLEDIQTFIEFLNQLED